MAEAIISKLAGELLACWAALLAKLPEPPKYVCERAGGEVSQDVGTRFGDECCEGLAYVKVNEIYPSTSFPERDTEAYECIRAWAVELEMGVFRCVPQGGLGLVPCLAWTKTHELLMNDAQSMRQAICCLIAGRPAGTGIVPGSWVPLGPDGNCIGSTMTVLVQVALDSCKC